MSTQQFLETTRLLIRIETAEEYVRQFSILSDEALMKYYGFISLQQVENQREKVEGGLTTYRNKVLFFHLIDKQTQNIIGSFAYHNWYPSFSRAEMGAQIYKEEDKYKGYMSEAITKILEYGFEHLKLNRIEAIIDPSNKPSIRVAEKMGFKQEALLKEHYCHDGQIIDSLLLALLHKDYKAAQASF